jgi:acetyl-CoA acetyltransferase
LATPVSNIWRSMVGLATKRLLLIATEYIFLSGTKPEHFAKVAYKNHKHSVNNP